VNLTHRNWTAVGQPELPVYPIVDPRGLVTPLYDGWSVDFWFMTGDGEFLLPSRLDTVEQELQFSPNLCITTRARDKEVCLSSEVWLAMANKVPELNMRVSVDTGPAGWLVTALRPYNPEGIQFIEKVAADAAGTGWLINGRSKLRLGEIPADREVVVVCKMGIVAKRATRLLREEGYDAATLRGGMSGWRGYQNGSLSYKIRSLLWKLR